MRACLCSQTNSFYAPDEEIFFLKHTPSNRIVFFRSHRIVSENSIRLLLGGTAKELKSSGIGMVAWEFALEYFKSEGFRTLYTSFSAANLEVINLEVSKIGFKILRSNYVYGLEINSIKSV